MSDSWVFTGKARTIFCRIIRKHEPTTEILKKVPDLALKSFALDNAPIENLIQYITRASRCPSSRALLIVAPSNMALSCGAVFRRTVPVRLYRRKIATKHLVQVATANHKRPFAVTRLRLHNPVKYNANTGRSIARGLKKREWKTHQQTGRTAVLRFGLITNRPREAWKKRAAYISGKKSRRAPVETAATASAGKNEAF